LHLGHGYEVPINSGMISLVFKAAKKSDFNKKVIIKMKRKNIEQKLNDAIDNLLFTMYILSFIPIINKYQLANVVTKNVEIIRQQTNFLEEVDNMNLIRDNCKNLKYVKIPTANREVTEEYPDIILMDCIDGLKINQIEESDYEGFAKQVVKFGLVTTIVHGVTHGDLHSGNVLFIKNENDKKCPYKIGVIDFGIIYNVDNRYKGLLFDIFSKIFDMPPRESAEKLLNSGIIEPTGILTQIPKDLYNNILLNPNKYYEEKEAELIKTKIKIDFCESFKEFKLIICQEDGLNKLKKSLQLFSKYLESYVSDNLEIKVECISSPIYCLKLKHMNLEDTFFTKIFNDFELLLQENNIKALINELELKTYKDKRLHFVV
jgi:predicted unusual protein kinase regulating ubiquinone biosynthesis (AarF/ABC1/UbiB family)